MTNLPTVADYLATQLAANAPGALVHWTWRAEMAAPPTLTERTALVELHSSRELVAGNMTCRVEGRIVASGGGDSAATTPAYQAELAELMRYATDTLTELQHREHAVDAAGNGFLLYAAQVGQQIVQPSPDFAQLLTVLPFTLFIQL